MRVLRRNGSKIRTAHFGSALHLISQHSQPKMDQFINIYEPCLPLCEAPRVPDMGDQSDDPVSSKIDSGWMPSFVDTPPEKHTAFECPYDTYYLLLQHV